MTPYEITHVFPGITPHDLLAAMTTPAHQQLQDKVAEIERRDFIGRESDAQHYRCECMVYPRRKIPAYVRPLLGGGLECHEVVLWNKANDFLEIDVRPAVLGGRCRVQVTCHVSAEGTSAVRKYSGEVSAEVRLIGPKIERAIVAEMLKTLDAAAAATRAWLPSRPR